MPEAQVDVLKALEAEVLDACSYAESEIAPIREAATRFYNAEPFGDEEEGRSQIVIPVVRDTVRATLPSLMRVFFGGQRVVEFTGSNGVSAEIADDMTEAVHHVVMRANPGFEIFWAAFKDALVRKVGWIEWYWDESIEQKSKTFSGVTDEQLADIEAELKPGENIEVLQAEQVGEAPPQPVIDPATQQPLIDPATGQPAMLPPAPILEYKVRLTTKKPRKQAKICAVPPEEIIWSRDATSPYTARLIGRQREITRGEAVSMGIPQEIIDAAEGGYSALQFNMEKLARNPGVDVGTDAATQTPDQQKLFYFSGFYRVDQDGDGISELRRICTLGTNFIEVLNEYADEVQLAAFCPDPEPHTVAGLSQADNVADLQVIESHVRRDILDSLKASIFPRMAYVEGQANVDDVLNTEIGGAIRMLTQGAVTPIAVPFLGQQAYPVLEDLQNMRESRTGISRNAMGLDPRALQSTNAVAVAQAVTAAQAQIELIARIFAESGMTRLFRGIAKLLVENQSGEFIIPVRGEMKAMNPSKWDLDAEMSVDTGLGVGSNDSKLATLQGTAQTQATILRELGLENPLCSMQELYFTQKRILELSGFRDVHRFFTNPAEKQEELEPQEPEPTPEQVLAQAQMKISAGELNVKRLDLILKDDRERDKMEIDMLLRAAELEATTGAKVDVAAIQAAVARQRDVAKAAQKAEAATK